MSDLAAVRTCRGCGVVLVKRPGERPYGFRARVNCNRTCANFARNPGPMWLEEDRGYTTPCWVWRRALNSDGYGLFNTSPRVAVRAHRFVYESRVGPITDGFQLDHLCRVRSCVNPDHLEPVTNAENSRRGARAKLSHAVVSAIRSSDASTRQLAQDLGVSIAAVGAVRAGRSWTDNEAVAA
jgi:hypothetical protein